MSIFTSEAALSRHAMCAGIAFASSKPDGVPEWDVRLCDGGHALAIRLQFPHGRTVEYALPLFALAIAATAHDVNGRIADAELS